MKQYAEIKGVVIGWLSVALTVAATILLISNNSSSDFVLDVFYVLIAFVVIVELAIVTYKLLTLSRKSVYFDFAIMAEKLDGCIAVCSFSTIMLLVFFALSITWTVLIAGMFYLPYPLSGMPTIDTFLLLYYLALLWDFAFFLVVRRFIKMKRSSFCSEAHQDITV